MTQWETFTSLCKILGGFDQQSLANAIDSNHFSDIHLMAEERNLLPALASRIDAQPNNKPHLSAAMRDQLSAAIKKNAKHKMQILAQSINLARVLNANNVVPMFLKGTAMMLDEQLSPMAHRIQVDIDIIVSEADRRVTAEILMADGYVFCDILAKKPALLTDLNKAIKVSTHHHHLPPMFKQGYQATVELHKTPLMRRFRGSNQVDELLRSGVLLDRGGAKIKVPSLKHQLGMLVAGSYITDGFAARCDFPIRTGLDYVRVASALQRRDVHSNQALVPTQLKKRAEELDFIARELLGMPIELSLYPEASRRKRLELMRHRYNSSLVRRVLDAQARCRYLACSSWFDTGKLPDYIRRKLR